jgi:hypothetical protein
MCQNKISKSTKGTTQKTMESPNVMGDTSQFNCMERIFEAPLRKMGKRIPADYAVT